MNLENTFSRGKNSHILGLIMFFYLMFTVFLFEFGPWPWPVENKVLLYSYLIINNFLLLLGYFIGINTKRISRSNMNYETWFKLSLLISIVLLVPTSLTRTGQLFPSFVGVLENLGNAYFETRQIRQENSSVVEYIRMLFSPILFSLYPLTLYYWSEIRKRYKYISLIVCILYLLISINMGINKVVVDYLIILFVIITIKKFNLFKKNIDIKHLIKKTIIVFTLVVICTQFLSYFQSTQESRVGEHVGEYNHRVGIYSNENALLIKYLPKEIQAGTIQLSSYITQGYYGLSLSMKEDFSWTYGVGSSIFVMKNIESLFDVDIESKTYPFKTIKYGWDPYIKWSSIYSWLGSDITFLGVFVFITIIGYLFGLAINDLVNNRNFLAVPSLCQLSILIFYIPANNQVMQSGEAFFGFFMTITIWLFSRKYKLVLNK
ncbi:hypothetical protein [Virgibacillus halodenitrificans]|uniref:hypothetical protein n=1 Tax=Virgibacillus halodenitrificans TaxID=1482 RepID=UPI000761ACDE